ncbi:MAG: VOC family protein [Chthonomonadales bacterium]|nr:VOC family protein [Chthonomonadales bacterium]
MDLGAFSISLAVRDLETSRSFYEKLGFAAVAGVASERWLIMKNGTAVIGLFQGMLEKNTLTFNPGWDADAQPLDTFTDVRDIQTALMDRGIELSQKVEESTAGPAYLVLTDPDGNPVLIDQHR